VRFFKVVAVTVVTLLTIFIITYNARISVIKNLAKEQLSLYQVEINCLDISLASNMAIMVDKLCLQSTKADIDIVDMAIQWQYFPQFKITKLDVKLAKVKGTEHLFSHIDGNSQEAEPANNKYIVSQLLSEILQPILSKVEQLQLPLDFNITNISYIPFTVKSKSKNRQQEVPYVANLAAVNNDFTFSLQNTNDTKFIEAKLNKKEGKAGFSIELSSELNLLKNFANLHRLPINAELLSMLATSEISGNIEALVEYQAGLLRMQSQITNFNLVSSSGFSSSVPFKLTADLNVESQFPLIANQMITNSQSGKLNENNQEIALTFVGKNALSLEYNQPNFITVLKQEQLSPAIISLIVDNPLEEVTVKAKNNTIFTLRDNQLKLSGIDISANGDSREHQVTLDKITLDFANSTKGEMDNNLDIRPENSEKASNLIINQRNNQTVEKFTIENFVIDSQLKLSNIIKYTAAPVALHLDGSFKKADKQTELKLTENSFITAKNVEFTKQKNSSIAKTTATKNKFLLTLQTLTTKLEGHLQLMADNALNMNLKANTQGLQVNIPKSLQINSFDMLSEIKGNVDDIQINTSASADGVSLGSLSIVGPVQTPKILITASKLALTDLLSLNIQLPTKMELIDGMLDYSVSGELTDWSQLEQSLFSISVALSSVSGEVNNIWIQELNWQQSFTLLAGEIMTLPNATKNLTVELIETPTPISKLSVNTNWTFNKNFKLSATKLKADVLGGSFSIPKITWPFEQDHSVDVQLNSIDLEQVLALDKKQGIVVTGDISGQLPIIFDGEKYIIENGELHNISHGLIQVMDNPAVVELKENNTQLQLAFEALQNLHYHQLSSEVSMAEDGYMLLETVIKGRNPDIDNDVNLNLNLSYDLLGLLESISITQRFEESIIKGLQQNKE
jgi:hypothetical protein